VKKASVREQIPAVVGGWGPAGRAPLTQVLHGGARAGGAGRAGRGPCPVGRGRGDVRELEAGL
jgi:hypothetical protein